MIESADTKPAQAGSTQDELFATLRLTMTAGLGPMLIGRLLARTHGSAVRAVLCKREELLSLEGIGQTKATAIARALAESEPAAQAELALARTHGVTILVKHLAHSQGGYPSLLAVLPDAPPLLYVKGELREEALKYPVAIVGSRACSMYGIEQAGRFAGMLAGAGLTIVSGGARGIDSAAHLAALEAGGTTIVVQGCGLAQVYPPENKALFERAAERGAVVSELPMNSPPEAGNFPARNRIISGLCLGVIVIEAAEGSGALITARVAAEDHGREVMALPGRVDSPSSKGSLALLKAGGALLVTDPKDVIAILESPARHQHGGTHPARFALASHLRQEGLFGVHATLAGSAVPITEIPKSPKSTADPGEDGGLSETPMPSLLPPSQAAILQALGEDATFDQLCVRTAMDAGKLRADLTMLEVLGKVKREGSRFRAVPRAGRQ